MESWDTGCLDSNSIDFSWNELRFSFQKSLTSGFSEKSPNSQNFTKEATWSLHPFTGVLVSLWDEPQTLHPVSEMAENADSAVFHAIYFPQQGAQQRAWTFLSNNGKFKIIFIAILRPIQKQLLTFGFTTLFENGGWTKWTQLVARI